MNSLHTADRTAAWSGIAIYQGRLFLTVSEVADLLEVDPRTVRRGMAAGDIPSVNVGPSTVRIPVIPFLSQVAGLSPEELHRLGLLDTPDSSEAVPDSTANAQIRTLTKEHLHVEDDTSRTG